MGGESTYTELLQYHTHLDSCSGELQKAIFKVHSALSLHEIQFVDIRIQCTMRKGYMFY